MSNFQNRPGISPEDVLKQIDYENIKKDIPEQEYDFVDLKGSKGYLSMSNIL